MKAISIIAGVVVGCALSAHAEVPRLKPLVESEMSDAQLKAYRELAAGPRGRVTAPFHALLRSPELMARTQKLGEFLRFGRGEEKSGGRQKNALLADVFEAITGAIFLDGGLEAATRFVCFALRDELEGADPLTAAKADYKTMLQERLQAARRPAPRYAVIETLGPPHQRIFHVEVSWDGGSIQGEGHSIKAAEAAAARAALEGMTWPDSDEDSLN